MSARAAKRRAIFLDRGGMHNIRQSMLREEQSDDRVRNRLEAAKLIETPRLCEIMNVLENLQVKIFADGADKEGMLKLYRNPLIKGLTTNPTLMRKGGIVDYESFARGVLEEINDKSISFEVFSDEFSEMKRQALKIRDWQNNAFVKIPITNSHGESSIQLIRELAAQKVQLSITAILTIGQVQEVAAALNPGVPAVSVFAGRIADTGRDPQSIMRQSKNVLGDLPHTELLWASVREVLNIIQANDCGAEYRDRASRHPRESAKTCGDGSRSPFSGYSQDVCQGSADAGFHL
jgi:transaldolase